MRSTGFSLPELLACLFVMGMATHLSIGPIRRQHDAIVLRGAREEIVGLFHRARMEARMAGEATLRVEEGADPALVLEEGRAPVRVPLRDRGVEIEIGGNRTSVEFVFGPAGIAELASATLLFQKGEVETTLVVSSYGRVRR